VSFFLFCLKTGLLLISPIHFYASGQTAAGSRHKFSPGSLISIAKDSFMPISLIARIKRSMQWL
jgi:hypothetical protein